MRLLLFLISSALLAAVPLRACSVPVFRYALEHWPADTFEAVVLHRGALTEPQFAWVRELRAEGLAGALHANVSVQTVDLEAAPRPAMLALARTAGAGALPWLVVKMPRTVKSGAIVWSSPLDGEAIRQLLDSPARQEIVARLSQGQSAVWLLLECGERAKDAAAAKLLEERLSELASTLTLPRLEASDIANGLVSVAQEDLRLEFSVLKIARDATGERAFIQMLLATERDLAAAHEPIAIPIFGRGRALYAFVGAGLQRDTIAQAASFLIGKCSCQVKELNPGADLLFAADWDALVKAHSAPAPDLPTLAELTRAAPVTVVFGETKVLPPKTIAAQIPRPYFLGLAMFGGLLAVVSLLWMLLRSK